MGDQKPHPAPPPPPISGDEEAPRTHRGRPTLPGGIGAAAAGSLGAPPRASSRPPPLPASPAPSVEPAALLEDSLDDGTPVPDTKPSVSRDPASMAKAAAGPPVVVMPTISVGEPDLSPLPPPAIIQPDIGAPDRDPRVLRPEPQEGDAAPRSSRPPHSIAPAMPQIPKPVSYKAPELAPGIVSDHGAPEETQAIPLTTPARSYKGPVLVAAACALIGGAIAFAVLLWMKPEGSGDASAATAATTAEAAQAAPKAAAPASATPAPAASSAATATASAAASPPSAEPAPQASAAPSATAASGAPPPSHTIRPAGTRPARKSDRIED